MFDPHWRQRSLEGLGTGFDLIVIGGGITGCGIFLDAVLRGLRVLLIEKGDIASGTSSRSSKLIHGGLRYLKQMQVGITRQACRERDLMLQLSPRLVQPIDFVYPIYEGDKMPAWVVGFGLKMYDRLTSSPDKHRRLSVEELSELAPGIATDGLDSVLCYRDARTDDARLTAAVAATGVAHGGAMLTRAQAAAGIRDNRGRLVGCVVEDLESGRSHQVSAQLVINAAGVWVDQTRHLLGAKGTKVRPSRGSHLILAPERLELGAAITVPSPDDGRPVFCIPHPEGVLVGTTDLYHDGSLDDPEPTLEETTYLLRAVQATFPLKNLVEDDVVGSFAGLRPILDTDAAEPSDASREKAIWIESGLMSIAGGKLTTWRAMAEEVVDKALNELPSARRQKFSACATTGMAIGQPAVGQNAAVLSSDRLVPASVGSGMLRRLGGNAWTAIALAGRKKELEPIAGSDLCLAEVRFHLRHGGVLHLDDLLLRRVRIGMWQPRQAWEVAQRLRLIFRSELGWRTRRWIRELEAFDQALSGWRAKKSPSGTHR